MTRRMRQLSEKARAAIKLHSSLLALQALFEKRDATRPGTAEEAQAVEKIMEAILPEEAA